MNQTKTGAFQFSRAKGVQSKESPRKTPADLRGEEPRLNPVKFPEAPLRITKAQPVPERFSLNLPFREVIGQRPVILFHNDFVEPDAAHDKSPGTMATETKAGKMVLVLKYTQTCIPIRFTFELECQGRPGPACMVPLTNPDPGGMADPTKLIPASQQTQLAIPPAEVMRLSGVSQPGPFQGIGTGFKVVVEIRWRHLTAIHRRKHATIPENRPALRIPTHRINKNFPAQHMEAGVALWPNTMRYPNPFTIRKFHQVGMPNRLDGRTAAAVRQDRIAGVGFKGPVAFRLRAIVCMCPYSVPPSAIQR